MSSLEENYKKWRGTSIINAPTDMIQSCDRYFKSVLRWGISRTQTRNSEQSYSSQSVYQGPHIISPSSGLPTLFMFQSLPTWANKASILGTNRNRLAITFQFILQRSVSGVRYLTPSFNVTYISSYYIRTTMHACGSVDRNKIASAGVEIHKFSWQ